MSTETTIPQVFIIESLNLSDEKEERFEGRILKQILRLSDKQAPYYYIRTKRELDKIARIFGESRFRYLHISCHGNQDTMATTFDRLSFEEVGDVLRPYLEGRRVFLSACEMTNRDFASELLTDSGCYSVIGPAEDVAFSDAALLWSSFYHLAFRTNETLMQREWILEHLKSTASLFQVRMNYFSASRSKGIRETVVEPGRA